MLLNTMDVEMTRTLKQAATLLAGAVLMGQACIYTEGIDPVNKRPEAVLTVVTAEPIHVGDEVVLSAEESRDPDGRVVKYTWAIEFDVPRSGETYTPCLGRPPCQGEQDEPVCCFIPKAKTTFTVRLQVMDDKGVSSEAVQRSIGIENRPPSAVIGVDSRPNDRGHFVVGQEVWLQALGSTDQDLGDTLLFHWDATLRPPGSSAEAFVFQPSNADRQPTDLERDAVYCLMVPDYPGSYEVSLTVSDGDATDTVVKHLEVDEDGPPCIRDSNPDWRSQVVVFEAGRDHRIEVLRVADDLDPYPPGGSLEFRWSILSDPQVGYVAVEGWNEPYLTMNGAAHRPGDHIRVRLVVTDRVERDLGMCAEDEKTCSLVTGCPQWVTWDIDYR